MRYLWLLSCVALASCAQAADDVRDVDDAALRQWVDSFYGDYLRPGVTAEQLLSHYAEDVEFVDPTFRIDVRGHDGLIRVFGQLGTPESNYRDVEWQIDKVMVDGQSVAVNGVMSGEWYGCPFEMAFVTIFDIEDGLIARQQDFFAASTFDEQVALDRDTGLPTCETSTASAG
ncbi:MAG: nuclear transport factor 2 family protein [Parasphingopyxis sp.]|uniref:nuclear transport factor 2 family protein n=1 Tax=Parasphingopyxis sp. TaxID=1920299 RepID=UPI003F9FF411